MATRPTRGNVVLGIRGWKIDYGKAGDYPRTVAAAQFNPVAGIPGLWDTVNATSALDTAFNKDAITNPAYGKKVLTDSMYALMLFFKSSYFDNLVIRIQAKYKKYFLKKPPLPVGYDTVYLIQYLDLNIAEYPELMDVSFAIGIPMVGKGKKPYYTIQKLAAVQGGGA